MWIAMTLELVSGEKCSHHRRIFTLVGNLVSSSFSRKATCETNSDSVSWQTPFCQWLNFGHTPKQLNTVSIIEQPQELGDYNFKYVSICDIVCLVHKKTFKLIQNVYVSNHTHARLWKGKSGKKLPSLLGEGWFSQRPIHVLQVSVCFHLQN